MVAPASRAAMIAEILANIPDNSTGLVTPAIVRATLDDFLSGVQIFNGDLTLHGDSNLAIPAATVAIATNATLTAPRAWTVPAASTVPAGQRLLIADAFGGVTSTDTLTLARASADTISGATSAVISVAYGWLGLVSDGVSKWTVVSGGQITSADISDATSVGLALITTASQAAAQSTLGLGSMATQAASAVAITGGAEAGVAVTASTLDSSPVGATTPSSGAFTTLKASGATTLSGGLALDSATTIGAAGSLGLQGYIGGLVLSNDAGTPNSIIDIASGIAQSDDASITMVLAAAITKTTGGTWAVGTGNGGLDVGAVLASTWYHLYLINRTDTGVSDVLLSQAPPPPNEGATSVTATNASPCVFTWNGGVAMPFENGAPIILGGTAAPTGFTAGTVYYAIARSQAAGTFELSATQGGAAINSTSTGTAVTAQCTPQLPASYTKKRYIGSIKTDTSSHLLAFNQNGNEFLWATAVQDYSTNLGGTSAVTVQLPSIPVGVKVNALVNAIFSGSTAMNNVLFSALDQVDQASNTPLGNYQLQIQVANQFSSSQLNIRSNTSEQIRVRGSTATTTFAIVTNGWIVTR
jgi:hypothetical protein